jgi:hypothetical protein
MGARASPGPDGGRGLTPAYAGGITGVRRWAPTVAGSPRSLAARISASLRLDSAAPSPSGRVRTPRRPTGSPRSLPDAAPDPGRLAPARPQPARHRVDLGEYGGARRSKSDREAPLVGPDHRGPRIAYPRPPPGGGGRRSGRRGEGSDGRDRDPQQRGRDIGTYARRRIAGAPACGEARHEPQDEEDKHHAGDVPRHGQQQRPLEPPPGPPTDPHLAPDGPPCLNGGPAAGMLRREDFPFKDRSREAGKGVRTNVARLRALPHPRPGVLPVRTPIASEEPG